MGLLSSFFNSSTTATNNNNSSNNNSSSLSPSASSLPSQPAESSQPDPVPSWTTLATPSPSLAVVPSSLQHEPQRQKPTLSKKRSSPLLLSSSWGGGSTTKEVPAGGERGRKKGAASSARASSSGMGSSREIPLEGVTRPGGRLPESADPPPYPVEEGDHSESSRPQGRKRASSGEFVGAFVHETGPFPCSLPSLRSLERRL
jgi:hypothetical protein